MRSSWESTQLVGSDIPLLPLQWAYEPAISLIIAVINLYMSMVRIKRQPQGTPPATKIKCLETSAIQPKSKKSSINRIQKNVAFPA
jgi:hypothetical protein